MKFPVKIFKMQVYHIVKNVGNSGRKVERTRAFVVTKCWWLIIIDNDHQSLEASIENFEKQSEVIWK